MKKHVSFQVFAAAALASCILPIAALSQYSEPMAAIQPERSHGGSNFAANRKLSEDALAADPQKTVAVIVQFKTADGAEQEQAVASARGSVQKHFWATHAVAAHLSGNAMQELANDSRVAYISLDRPLSFRGNVSSIATTAEYTVEPINAPAVWSQGYNGTGIGVAVIDSGVQNQPDLGSQPGKTQRIVYNASYPSNLPGGSNDSFGHGTHVAGLIAGNGNRSIGPQFTRTFSGVAPNANIVNLRVLDQNGAGTDSTVIQAIEAAISLKTLYNIRVINLSLGRGIWESYTQDPLCQAAEAAWKAGIVVVVAAGNAGRNQNLNPQGYGTIESPGNDPYVLTVGAMNTMNTASITDDIIGSYSSKGPSFIDDIAKPDIVAPGNLVTSLLIGGSTLFKQNPSFFTPHDFYISGADANASGDYMPLSGTSMAAAVTSGAVALLLQAQPLLTPDQVKALIMYSAQRSFFPTVSTATDPVSGIQYISHYDALTVGAGYLDIQATLNNALSMASLLPAGTAMSPTVSFNSSTGVPSLVTSQTALWGSTALWGASNVYGASAFEGVPNGATALWGQTALWGRDDPSGFTALWGQTALWGRSTPAAATALWGQSTVAGQTALWGRLTTDAD